MRGRSGSAESPQDQVVFRVVPCVPYCYILQQTNVCAQDVVGPGAHLPAAPVHVPCVAILQPQFVPWEELADHVLQALLCQGRCNPLVSLQVGVETAVHQQRGAAC